MYLKCPKGHSLEELQAHCFLMGSTNFQFEEVKKKEKLSFMPATLLKSPDMTTAICLTFNPRD